MRSICNPHDGIVLRPPSLLSLAIIWSKCVPRNSPKVHFDTTKTQPFTHFKLAIMLKLTVFKFICTFTDLWARKTAVRWPTQQRYPQVIVYKALCNVLRKTLKKKRNFKIKKEGEKKKVIMFLILPWLWSTLTTTNIQSKLFYITERNRLFGA